MDSLGLVELVMELAPAGDLALDADETEVLRSGTAADLWRIVCRWEGRTETGKPSANDPTWIRVQSAIARVLQLPAEEIGPDYRLDG